MLDLLWSLPVFPLVSFLVLALFGARLSKTAAGFLGVGSIVISALIAFAMAVRFLTSPPPGDVFKQTLWSWVSVGDLDLAITLSLDPLSLVMVLVVTVVGALIHLFAAEYMLEEPGYSRFFAYMNLFVASMLILVLADNLALLYLGWEGVGMCSYLLIGFWYSDPANGRAARKAFVVTRIGDTALIVAVFLLFFELGTLDIPEILALASQQWPEGSALAVVTAALLLGGAVGKSAQLPLQTWLPDAMAGPTPVSALIHAATMVTAGVYLIARTNTLFVLAPAVLSAVAIIGALTLLIAGFSALAQHDIKRILAYSTISQLGYMFLALGVGAFSGAIFHLMTHAFFKALLFLGAGTVSLALHHEQDIFKMGGLRKHLPVTFAVFLIAGASLAGFPLVTAGFYSKDSLLWAAWASDRGSVWLWAAGLLGAFVTSLYIFRLIFIVFFGPQHTEVHQRPGYRIRGPLIVLGALSLVGGFVELPATLGNVPLFSRLLQRTLPEPSIPHADLGSELALQGIAAVISLAGMLLAYFAFLRRPHETEETQWVPLLDHRIERFWLEGWRFDRLYELLFVRPFVWLAQVNKADIVDRIYASLTWLAATGNRALRPSQNGRLRWYAGGLAIGAVALITVLVAP